MKLVIGRYHAMFFGQEVAAKIPEKLIIFLHDSARFLFQTHAKQKILTKIYLGAYPN